MSEQQKMPPELREALIQARARCKDSLAEITEYPILHVSRVVMNLADILNTIDHALSESTPNDMVF